MKRLAIFAGLVLLFVPVVGIAAQTQPLVRVTVNPETVLVGEYAEVRVTVLAPTWFPQPPVFPAFELANAITRLPPNSSYPTSERVGGETWSGIVRNYRVYPLIAATYRLSGQGVTVTYADPKTRQAISADVAIPDIELRATVPVGAEGLAPYLAGRSLQLTLDIEGDTEQLKAGDAIELKYTAELLGLPAIFLPPLAPKLHLDGVSVYADEPVVEDGPPARRVERLTLVFTGGGEFDIPEVKLDWWNTETNTLERATAAGRSLRVEGPRTTPDSGESSGQNGFIVAGVVAGLALALFFLRHWRVSWRQRLQRARERRRQSEAHAFGEFRRALRAAGRSGEPGAVHHAMLRWLQRLATGMDARGFARQFGDAALCSLVDELSAALYANTKTEIPVDFRALETGLVAARRRYLRKSPGAALRSLPPLNP